MGQLARRMGHRPVWPVLFQQPRRQRGRDGGQSPAELHGGIRLREVPVQGAALRLYGPTRDADDSLPGHDDPQLPPAEATRVARQLRGARRSGARQRVRNLLSPAVHDDDPGRLPRCRPHRRSLRIRDLPPHRGASEYAIYRRIVLPLAKPAMATLAVFTFLGAWNDFLGPLIVVKSDEMRTLPLAISALSAGHYVMSWPLLMAGASFVVIPVLIVYLLAQRYFVEGIALGGLKG
ncbi:carbohydrate ABC transporter permease [bacterium]|nr:MAG: carbohydrate ABC transporter permease [bacterium]